MVSMIALIVSMVALAVGFFNSYQRHSKRWIKGAAAKGKTNHSCSYCLCNMFLIFLFTQ